MIEKKPDSFSDIVDRAMGELRSSPVPPELPPELLDALLQAAKEDTGPVQRTVEASAQAEIIHLTFPTHSLTKWKWIMRSSVSRIAAAAVFVFAIAGVALWFHLSGTQYALADFVKPILEAKSAKFKMAFEHNGKVVATADCMWLAPSWSRMEIQQPDQPVQITICDTSKGVSVDIHPARKVAAVYKDVGLSREKAYKPLAEMRALILDAGKPDVRRESLGEKKVDGRRAVGWRVSGPGLHAPGVTVTIWGDPQTGLPIRMESNYALNAQKNILSDFVFNVDLDKSLFSIEPPTGYTIETTQVDDTMPAEKDLITLLREYSTLMNNAFPESLDAARLRLTLQARIIFETLIAGNERPSDEFLRKIAEARTEEEIQKIVQSEFQAYAERLRRIRDAEPDKAQKKADSAEDTGQKAADAFHAKHWVVDKMITHSLGFVAELPREADVHYAGKGVSLGAPSTPIFWYRPKDATKYRIVYADLSAREADTPPNVPDAQPVPTPFRPKE